MNEINVPQNLQNCEQMTSIIIGESEIVFTVLNDDPIFIPKKLMCPTCDNKLRKDSTSEQSNYCQLKFCQQESLWQKDQSKLFFRCENYRCNFRTCSICLNEYTTGIEILEKNTNHYQEQKCKIGDYHYQKDGLFQKKITEYRKIEVVEDNYQTVLKQGQNQSPAVKVIAHIKHKEQLYEREFRIENPFKLESKPVQIDESDHDIDWSQIIQEKQVIFFDEGNKNLLFITFFEPENTSESQLMLNSVPLLTFLLNDPSINEPIIPNYNTLEGDLNKQLSKSLGLSEVQRGVKPIPQFPLVIGQDQKFILVRGLPSNRSLPENQPLWIQNEHEKILSDCYLYYREYPDIVQVKYENVGPVIAMTGSTKKLKIFSLQQVEVEDKEDSKEFNVCLVKDTFQKKQTLKTQKDSQKAKIGHRIVSIVNDQIEQKPPKLFIFPNSIPSKKQEKSEEDDSDSSQGYLNSKSIDLPDNLRESQDNPLLENNLQSRFQRDDKNLLLVEILETRTRGVFQTSLQLKQDQVKLTISHQYLGVFQVQWSKECKQIKSEYLGEYSQKVAKSLSAQKLEILEQRTRDLFKFEKAKLTLTSFNSPKKSIIKLILPSCGSQNQVQHNLDDSRSVIDDDNKSEISDNMTSEVQTAQTGNQGLKKLFNFKVRGLNLTKSDKTVLMLFITFKTQTHIQVTKVEIQEDNLEFEEKNVPQILNDIPDYLCTFPVLVQARRQDHYLKVNDLISDEKHLKIDISPYIFQSFVQKGSNQQIGELDDPQAQIIYFLATCNEPTQEKDCCPQGHKLIKQKTKEDSFRCCKCYRVGKGGDKGENVYKCETLVTKDQEQEQTRLFQLVNQSEVTDPTCQLIICKNCINQNKGQKIKKRVCLLQYKVNSFDNTSKDLIKKVKDCIGIEQIQIAQKTDIYTLTTIQDSKQLPTYLVMYQKECKEVEIKSLTCMKVPEITAQEEKKIQNVENLVCGKNNKFFFTYSHFSSFQGVDEKRKSKQQIDKQIIVDFFSLQIKENKKDKSKSGQQKDQLKKSSLISQKKFSIECNENNFAYKHFVDGEDKTPYIVLLQPNPQTSYDKVGMFSQEQNKILKASKEKDLEKLLIVDSKQNVFILVQKDEHSNKLMAIQSVHNFQRPEGLKLKKCFVGERHIIQAQEDQFLIHQMENNSTYRLMITSLQAFLLTKKQEKKVSYLSVQKLQATSKSLYRAVSENFYFQIIKSSLDDRIVSSLPESLRKNYEPDFRIVQNLLSVTYYNLKNPFVAHLDLKTQMLINIVQDVGQQLVFFSSNGQKSTIVYWQKQKKILALNVYSRREAPTYTTEKIQNEIRYEFDSAKEVQPIKCFQEHVLEKENSCLVLKNCGTLVQYIFEQGCESEQLMISKYKKQDISIPGLIDEAYKLQIKFDENYSPQVKIFDKNLVVVTGKSDIYIFPTNPRENLQIIKPTLKILINDLLSDQDFQYGVKIEYTKQFHQDQLQISTPNIALIWNVKTNEQVKSYLGYQELTSIQFFVPNEMLIYHHHLSKQNMNKFQLGKWQTQQSKEANFFEILDNKTISSDFEEKIFSSPGSFKQQPSFLFLTYNVYNILQIQGRKSLHLGKKGQFGIDTILTSFRQSNTLNELMGREDPLSVIVEEIKSFKVQASSDFDQQEDSNNIIRKLYNLLTYVPTQSLLKVDRGQINLSPKNKLDLKIQNKSLNVIQYSLEQNIEGFKQYLQLLNFCDEQAQISDVVFNSDSLRKLFESNIEASSIFLDNCYNQTEQSQLVSSILWHPTKKVVVFSADSQLLKKEKIEERIVQRFERIGRFRKHLKRIVPENLYVKMFNKDRWVMKQCQVYIYDTKFLTEDPKGFLLMLASHANDEMYQNQLINGLIKEQNYKNQLLPHFSLYLLHNLFQFLYYYYVLPHNNSGPIKVFLGLVFAGFISRQFYNESIQLYYQRERYFTSSLLNFIQVTTFTLQIIILVAALILDDDIIKEENNIYSIILPSISVFLMTILIFDWMSLFEETSFVVQMIVNSIDDTKYFIVMMVICIMSFATAILIIDHNQMVTYQARGDEYQNFIDVKSRFSWIDAVFNQYLLGLGEFEVSEFNGETQENYNVYNQYSPSVGRLLWIYFLIATLLTQIIFMNTLIAILTDTYANIVQLKEYYTQRHQIRLYADYIHLIKIKDLVRKRYLYLVKPVDETTETVQVSDMIQSLSMQVSKEFDQTQVRLQHMMEELAEQKQLLEQQKQVTGKKLQRAQNIDEELEQPIVPQRRTTAEQVGFQSPSRDQIIQPILPIKRVSEQVGVISALKSKQKSSNKNINNVQAPQIPQQQLHQTIDDQQKRNEAVSMVIWERLVKMEQKQDRIEQLLLSVLEKQPTLVQNLVMPNEDEHHKEDEL